VVLKAVASDPCLRYGTAAEFRHALDEADRCLLGQCVRPTIPVPRGAVLCPACGAPVPDKDRFCGACGESVTGSSPNAASQATAPRSAPPVGRVKAGRHTTRVHLRAAGHKSDLNRLHEMRLDSAHRMHAARIVGASGVGRSTLLREFLVSARSSGDACAELQTDPSWAAPPCAGLRSLVASLAGIRPNTRDALELCGASASAAAGLRLALEGVQPRDLGLTPTAAREALREALRWALVRGAAGALTGRAVVGIDDMERIDGPTRNALMDALTSPAEANVVVVAAQSLEATIDWPRYATEHLLPGWDTQGASGVLTGFGGEIRLPDGPGATFTPLYLEQLIRFHFEGGHGPSLEVSDLIAQRLQALDADARTVLHTMTVLGDHVSVDDLLSILPSEHRVDEGVIALAQASILDRVGHKLVWTHPLLREVAASVMPAAARRDLHARAGALRAAQEAPLEVLAVHAREAEQWFDALFLMEQAAARCAALGDAVGSAEWLRTGFATVKRASGANGLDDPEQAMLSFGRNLGDTLMDCGQLTEADAVLREVLDFVGPKSAGYVQILRGLARVQRAGTGSGDPIEGILNQQDGPTAQALRVRGAGNAS